MTKLHQLHLMAGPGMSNVLRITFNKPINIKMVLNLTAGMDLLSLERGTQTKILKLGDLSISSKSSTYFTNKWRCVPPAPIPIKSCHCF
jgi:hypothetical protein